LKPAQRSSSASKLQDTTGVQVQQLQHEICLGPSAVREGTAHADMLQGPQAARACAGMDTHIQQGDLVCRILVVCRVCGVIVELSAHHDCLVE
jgi:hypothetical protein